MEHRNIAQQDPLRARFTVWLTRVIKRARIDYYRKNKDAIEVLSLEDLQDTPAVWEDRYDLRTDLDEDSFDFEGERLTRAFNALPRMRRRILTLLFVEELTPEEIAEQLHCTVQNIYNQKSLAIKAIRAFMKMTEEDDDMP